VHRIVQGLLLMGVMPAAAQEATDQSGGQTAGEAIREGVKEGASQSLTGGGPDNLVSLLSLGLGLIAVIAIIFVCAWLVKRMNGLAGANSKAMRIVSVMSVGSRERIALIEVGDKQLLVGITPSAIRTLHVFDEPVVHGSATGADGDFAKRLQTMIGRGWPGRRSSDHDQSGDRP
jgi:flagellar protein FliO/FliZ